MSGDIGRWNCGLLFAAIAIVFGLIGVVFPQRRSDRPLFQGLFLQGVLLICVVGAAYREQGSDLKLATFLVIGLLVIQQVMQPGSTDDDLNSDEDQPA